MLEFGGPARFETRIRPAICYSVFDRYAASTRSLLGMFRFSFNTKLGKDKEPIKIRPATQNTQRVEISIRNASAAAFWGFREGVFQKMPALEGQFLKEISVRFAGENHLRTQRKTHKTELCAEVPERPLPKDPLRSAAERNAKETQRVRALVATIHFSLFTCCFLRFFFDVHSCLFSAMRTPTSQNHSYVHNSLSKFTGEWFTNHSNHIHIFTPNTRIVATKVRALERQVTQSQFAA